MDYTSGIRKDEESYRSMISNQQIAEDDYTSAVQQKLDDCSRATIGDRLTISLRWGPIIRDAYSRFDRER